MGKYDFSGYATRNDLLCTDGRTIRKDAFKGQDGQKVPLVWHHQYSGPENILGHAILENREDGVYAYCSFNNSAKGLDAKEAVKHGDISSLSIFANNLKEVAGDVLHGAIRELSLVLAGANPGAFIDSVMAHGDDAESGIIVGYDENIMLYHSDDGEPPKKEDKEEPKKVDKTDDDETLADVFNTLSDKQKDAVYVIVGQIVDGDVDDNEPEEEPKGGDTTMKHNVFDKENVTQGNTLSHSAQEEIIQLAKSSQVGSFQTALEIYASDNSLQHDAISGGFSQTGEGNISTLFPEYKDVRPGAPELITNDQGWISVVLNKAHKSPISRIRTGQVDIRKIDALRGKGYEKGKKKTQVGNFSLVRRTTDPQTVYVKNALHRDDIVDIVDFDYVGYVYNIDKMMLREELATALMFGDGREDGDEDKIQETHIRPIWTDDDLYTLHVDLDVEAAKSELQGTNTGASFGPNYILAEAMINTMLYAREEYKGSGTPDGFITPHMLNVMLLARDMNGRRIYSSKAELTSALNLGNIYTVEQMEGKIRTNETNDKKKLLALVVNLADYSLGATKGGELTHFTQFDIDFNQMKSLLETRTSGALTRVYSAIAIEEPVVATNPVG